VVRVTSANRYAQGVLGRSIGRGDRVIAISHFTFYDYRGAKIRRCHSRRDCNEVHQEIAEL
jgi:hypothetical protein